MLASASLSCLHGALALEWIVGARRNRVRVSLLLPRTLIDNHPM
jgi:hypothetical protein